MSGGSLTLLPDDPGPAGPAAPLRKLPARVHALATGFPMAIVLVGLYWAMAVSSQLDKSAAFDEIAHLTAGYSYWTLDDYRLHPENGVLPQRWAALPLLAGDYRFPSLDQKAWRNATVFELGEQFFYQLGNPLETMLLRGRAMIALAGAGLGLLIYAWSRSLFGAAGGMVSLWLFVFYPGMLANGSLITSDMLLMLTLTASTWCFWTMLHRPSAATVVVSALAMGLLFVSKVSAFVMLPLALGLLVVRLIGERQRGRDDTSPPEGSPLRLRPAALAVSAVVHLVMVLAVVWICYGARYSAFGPASHPEDRFSEAWEDVLPAAGILDTVIRTARAHQLLPEAFLYGFAGTLHLNQTRSSFLNGEYSRTGWWYYFPYVVLVKTPLPLFLVLGFAAAWAVRTSRTDRSATRLWIGQPWYQLVPLGMLLLAYGAVSLASNLNVGHRHILPIYPALFILAGAAASWFGARHRQAGSALAICLLWFAAESLTIRPHYLAYFNQLAGGPSHAYRHLVDSSLDWGQDLPGLRRWLDRNGAGGPSPSPVYLSYFGTGNPRYYGITARLLPSFIAHEQRSFPPLAGGIYCISATMLQGVYLEIKRGWSPLHEKIYREVRGDIERYERTRGDAESRRRLVQERGPAFWFQRYEVHEQLQFARLTRYLLQREPDDQVGYSILIYRLSDAQVRDALDGPLPELRQDQDRAPMKPGKS